MSELRSRARESAERAKSTADDWWKGSDELEASARYMAEARRYTRAAQYARRQEKRKETSEMINCMKEAMDENDTRAVWELARRVGARGRTAKKRRVYVQRTAVPTAEEWRAYLAQEGKDGGCKAAVVDGGAVK